MTATLFSLIIALALWFFPLSGDLTYALSVIFITFPAILLLIMPLIYASAWLPLQKGEQNLTPRLIEMFSHDRTLRLTAAAVFLFPLLSIALFLMLHHAPEIDKKILFLGWLVLFGGIVDLGRSYLRRITAFLDPFRASEIFTARAKENIKLDQLDKVIDSIDALSEVSIRAIERYNTSLAIQGITELRDLGDFFMKSAKGFLILNEETQNLAEKHVDRVSYTLFYLISRLEMTHEKAVQKRFELVSSQVLSALGRITIAAAKYDMSLATYPLLTLGRASLAALENNLKETAVKGGIILLEIAKAIIKEVDITYVELKSPFFTLIDNLDKLSKEMFKQDKNISIPLLTQPFYQLKEILNDPKVTNHQDYSIIHAEIERILAEYAALAAVLATIPPISVPDNQ